MPQGEEPQKKTSTTVYRRMCPRWKRAGYGTLSRTPKDEGREGEGDGSGGRGGGGTSTDSGVNESRK